MKKGFTLIELLAVIIILGVIAIIATPMVLDVINDAKNSARESKLELYADSMKLKRTEKLFSNIVLNDDDLTPLAEEIADPKISCSAIKYRDIGGITLYGCDIDNETDYCYKNGVVKQGEDCSAFLDDTVPTITPTTLSIVVPPNSDIDIRNYFVTTYGFGGGDLTCSANNTNELSGLNTVTCTANGKNALSSSASMDVRVAYTITYNMNGGNGEAETQYKEENSNLVLTDVVPTRSEYTFLGWSTSNTAKTSDYTSLANYTTNNNATLYAVWKSIYLDGNVAIGDYISMTPSRTSYTTDSGKTGYSSQTINPSELNLWRVIRVNNDGSIDAVSEYTNSTMIYFVGRSAYSNFTNYLTTLAQQYVNSNYTISARGITSSDINLIKSGVGTLTAKKLNTTSAVQYWVNGLSSQGYYNAGSSGTYYYGTYATGETTDYDTSGYAAKARKNSVLYDAQLGSSDWFYYSARAGGSDSSSSTPRGHYIRSIVTFKPKIIAPTGDGKTGATAWDLN